MAIVEVQITIKIGVLPARMVNTFTLSVDGCSNEMGDMNTKVIMLHHVKENCR